MQTRHRIFEDAARFVGSFAHLAGASKNNCDDFLRQKLQELLNSMDVVPREEFEAVKSMATKALSENAQLRSQIAQLQKQSSSAVRRPPRKSKNKTTDKQKSSS